MIRDSFKLHGDAAGKSSRATAKKNADAPTSVRPHPDVWATALRGAENDVRRLEVESDGSVIIHNNPRSKKGQ